MPHSPFSFPDVSSFPDAHLVFQFGEIWLGFRVSGYQNVVLGLGFTLPHFVLPWCLPASLSCFFFFLIIQKIKCQEYALKMYLNKSKLTSYHFNELSYGIFPNIIPLILCSALHYYPLSSLTYCLVSHRPHRAFHELCSPFFTQPTIITSSTSVPGFYFQTSPRLSKNYPQNCFELTSTSLEVKLLYSISNIIFPVFHQQEESNLKSEFPSLIKVEKSFSRFEYFDIQHVPAKLPSKLHLFASVDVLAQEKGHQKICWAFFEEVFFSVSSIETDSNSHTSDNPDGLGGCLGWKKPSVFSIFKLILWYIPCMGLNFHRQQLMNFTQNLT
ncbi:hypothetical protein VP01_5791g1 [Puccinia sorghi]|uniref:Uncharacterized protein n=1 Tax=Puccinia sorghi TaxID=27349 RepID=A0A0L6UIZ7_9BASI|nr:hypothetical protein VP01_5791g1 [Puccinia sorghi]